MPLEHDPVKASANLEKHGVSFADAEGVLFDLPALTVEDVGAVGEQRLVTLGPGSAGELLVVVYTHRDNEPRLISARRATRKERKIYESRVRLFKGPAWGCYPAKRQNADLHFYR